MLSRGSTHPSPCTDQNLRFSRHWDYVLYNAHGYLLKIPRKERSFFFFLRDIKTWPFCTAPDVAPNMALSPGDWGSLLHTQLAELHRGTPGNLNEAFHRKASNMNIWVLHWWLIAFKMSALTFEALSAYFRDRFAPHSTPLNLLSSKALWLQLPWNRERSLQWRPGDAGTRSHFTIRQTHCLSPAQPFKKLPVPAPSEAEE